MTANPCRDILVTLWHQPCWQMGFIWWAAVSNIIGHGEFTALAPKSRMHWMQLESGAHTTPNMRATEVELYEGLSATSQNCWPSVKFDLGAISSRLSRLLPAGFYYKTFMWPASMWMTYEK